MPSARWVGCRAPREPQLSTDSIPKTMTSLGTHSLRFSPNFSSIFSSHRRSIMEHVNSVFPFLYNVSQPPFKYNSLSGFAPKYLTFYFHFNISCHPDINRWAGTMQYPPPSALPAPPTPKFSHTQAEFRLAACFLAQAGSS